MWRDKLQLGNGKLSCWPYFAVSSFRIPFLWSSPSSTKFYSLTCTKLIRLYHYRLTRLCSGFIDRIIYIVVEKLRCFVLTNKQCLLKYFICLFSFSSFSSSPSFIHIFFFSFMSWFPHVSQVFFEFSCILVCLASSPPPPKSPVSRSVTEATVKPVSPSPSKAKPTRSSSFSDAHGSNVSSPPPKVQPSPKSTLRRAFASMKKLGGKRKNRHSKTIEISGPIISGDEMPGIFTYKEAVPQQAPPEERPADADHTSTSDTERSESEISLLLCLSFSHLVTYEI